jgi:hypothetical protein
LAVYYPLVGLINLFLYVIKYPNASSAESDIALLEVAVGHFSYLSFILDSYASFNFIKDFVPLARSAIRQANNFQPHSQPYASSSLTLVEDSQSPHLSNPYLLDDVCNSNDLQLPVVSGVSGVLFLYLNNTNTLNLL